MWFKFAYTLDARNRKSAVRWSAKRGRWIPTDMAKAQALYAEGLVEFTGWL